MGWRLCCTQRLTPTLVLGRSKNDRPTRQPVRGRRLRYQQRRHALADRHDSASNARSGRLRDSVCVSGGAEKHREGSAMSGDSERSLGAGFSSGSGSGSGYGCGSGCGSGYGSGYGFGSGLGGGYGFGAGCGYGFGYGNG